jgi:DNA polymerase III subunit epsilon
MGFLNKDIFVCLDCETTGLDPKTDRIIEVAATTFTFSGNIESFETLVDPECTISESSMAIHHITQDMVKGKPKILEVLPKVTKLLAKYIVIGHGIKLDLNFLAESAKRNQFPFSLESYVTIDTLRLARLYGESPTNSLEKLREHFNIESEGAHRAMSDVTVNISVFKYLSQTFKTTEQLLERLKKPILLKTMPLGKYKGRPFSDLPIEYLQWASHADFDQDLIFSVRTELQKRKKGDRFLEATNPFSQL